MALALRHNAVCDTVYLLSVGRTVWYVKGAGLSDV